MKRNVLLGVAMFAAVFLVAAGAQAFTVTGLTYGDWVSADVDFSVDGNQVTVTITNTSLADAAKLTGFAFNAEGVSSLVDFSGLAGWTGVFSPDGIDTPQNIGFFDVAAITGPNLNGGDPNLGIAIGDSGTFTFLFDGAGSFLSELSAGGDIAVSFAARFQAITIEALGVAGGSDVATVPIPGAVWLLGSGLLGIIGLRRKNR